MKVTFWISWLGSIKAQVLRRSFVGADNEEYTKINPNGRIPAIVDHKRNDFVVWESGAILLYLVKHYDPEYKLWSKDDDEQSHILEWLFFQVSGFGPYIGQAFWYPSQKFANADSLGSLSITRRKSPLPSIGMWMKSNVFSACWRHISRNPRTKDILRPGNTPLRTWVSLAGWNSSRSFSVTSTRSTLRSPNGSRKSARAKGLSRALRVDRMKRRISSSESWADIFRNRTLLDI